MELTNEQLDMLEKMGGTFFSVNECAIVLQVDESKLRTLLKQSSSEAYKRYYKGFIAADITLRESIIKMAGRGSNPAQKMATDMRDNAKTKNL